MDIFLFKIVIIVVIFLTGVIGGLMPRLIGRSKSGNSVLMLGSAFTGGVFLGAGLIHLLGDSLEMMGDFLGEITFPWAFFIMGLGFLLILFIEKIFAHSDESAVSTSTQPYILLLILSVHSVIAGAALGLEASVATSLILLFAIIAHKAFAAFALGISFHNAAFDFAKSRNLVLFFSLMTSTGVLIGTLIANLLHSHAVLGAEAIFDALAAGTFLYVATFDVLKESFEGGRRYVSKFALAAMGFLLMAVLAIWT